MDGKATSTSIMLHSVDRTYTFRVLDMSLYMSSPSMKYGGRRVVVTLLDPMHLPGMIDARCERARRCGRPVWKFGRRIFATAEAGEIRLLACLLWKVDSRCERHLSASHRMVKFISIPGDRMNDIVAACSVLHKNNERVEPRRKAIPPDFNI